MKKIIIALALLTAGLAAQTYPPVTSTQFFVPPISAPSSPQTVSVTRVGQPGNISYYYWVVAEFGYGNSAPSTVIALSANSNTNLDSSNYNRVSWSTVLGATGYDLLRTTDQNPPTGQCNCAVVINTSGVTYNDQSNSLNNYTVTTYSTAPTFQLTNIPIASDESQLTFSADRGAKFEIDSKYGAIIPSPTLSNITVTTATTAGVNETLQQKSGQTGDMLDLQSSSGSGGDLGSIDHAGVFQSISANNTTLTGTTTNSGTITGGAVNPATLQGAQYVTTNYGAKCDGVTDDTTAIQNALNSVGTAPLIIPAGANCLVTAPLTYKNNLHLIGYNSRTSQSLISWSLAAGASGTTTLLQPASGQSSANTSITGVFFDAASVTSTGATVVLESMVNGNSAIRSGDNYYGSITSHAVAPTFRFIGLDISTVAGGSSFYQQFLNTKFSQLTTDVEAGGIAGDQWNGAKFINVTFADGADYDTSGDCNMTSFGTGLDIAGYAADITLDAVDWPDPTCAFMLHGTTTIATGIIMHNGAYLDAGAQAPFIAFKNVGNAASASYQGTIRADGLSGFDVANGYSDYVYGPAGAVSIASPTGNLHAGTLQGDTFYLPNTVTFATNVGANRGVIGGQGDQGITCANLIGGNENSCLVSSIIGTNGISETDWGGVRTANFLGVFAARVSDGSGGSETPFQAGRNSAGNAVFGLPAGYVLGIGTVGPTGPVPDVGLSRDAADTFDCGNGTQGDKTCTLNLATLNSSAAVNMNGGGTIASGQTLTATGATITGPTLSGVVSVGSASNCSSSASPAVCGSAVAGSVSIAASATTVIVDTTAVTANSQIFIQEDDSLGTKLGVTCNTTVLGSPPEVTARTAGTSFTITTSAAPVTNPACYSYFIVN